MRNILDEIDLHDRRMPWIVGAMLLAGVVGPVLGVMAVHWLGL